MSHTPPSSKLKLCFNRDFDWYILDADETQVKMLREHYLCPHFRILVIGRANAGKTTILEKVCGVVKGTNPIIYDKNGKFV